MVAGVALPQNPNSAPFRFSLGYHNITIPGDRSHHAPVPKHVIIDRDKDDNEYYTRLFAKEQSYRSMLRILVLTETDSRTENSGMYDTDTKAPASL